MILVRFHQFLLFVVVFPLSILRVVSSCVSRDVKSTACQGYDRRINNCLSLSSKDVLFCGVRAYGEKTFYFLLSVSV